MLVSIVVSQHMWSNLIYALNITLTHNVDAFR